MKNIIFSIYVDIPEDELDNPGGYSHEGIQDKSSKSQEVKASFEKYAFRLTFEQVLYATSINATYTLYGQEDFQPFKEDFQRKYPQISVYDIVNFYKHHLMYELSNDFDNVCYIDFDVVPNTDENIFEAFDKDKFAIAENNAEAVWGKTVEHKYYNTCIRNPATKYWNAHAMLIEEGYDPDADVFNTGIMVASSKVIQDLNYFENFEDIMSLMTDLKEDEFSMYPKNIQRVFNYDNETIFAYNIVTKGIPIDYMGRDWHCVIVGINTNPNAKMYHIINKKFEAFL